MGLNDTILTDNVYTLRQLLGSGSVDVASDCLNSGLTLVIPDMQRDYCWAMQGGSKLHTKSKVSMFVSGLVYLYRNDKESPLGLLYGYEEPKGSRRIMVIDGQQRITTLYLLIGMLYRRTSDNGLRQMLISDYELIDNHEPRLLYQARTEALYFMSDLVVNFFLDRDGRLSQLELSSWYHLSYDSDPTVQSFIKAIRLIDEVLEDAAKTPGWDFKAFADFVADRLVFLYHDLGSRVHAESVFVTLNTTGEPLTYAQNVKSLSVAMSADPQLVIDRWEEMEQWAWMRRDRSRNTTSDMALERFLRLWIARNGGDADSAMHPDRFGSMYEYFCAYRHLTDCIPDTLHVSAETSSGQFLLLPMLAYIRRWRLADVDSQRSRRSMSDLWAWLTNITRYIKVNGSDTEAAVKIVRLMADMDITSMLGVRGVSDRLLNADERAKLSLIAANARCRGLVHRIIEGATRHPLLNGKMLSVINWCTDREGNVDLTRLARYVDDIYDIWGEDIDQNPALDDLRRALLTLRHPEYPIKRRGETCMSLCWRDYDWQRLMTKAPGLIRLIIDRLSKSKIPVRASLQQMCNKFADRSYPYFFLIKDPETIRRCEHRTLLTPCTPFIGFYLHDDNDSSWATDMRWFVEQMPSKIDKAHWTTLRAYGARCLYTDHRTYNLSIDLYYNPDSRMPYRIELFTRDDSDKPMLDGFDIAAYLGQYTDDVRYDRKRRRHYADVADARTVLNIIHRITRDHLDLD